jgi:hypothetical protein
MRITHILLLMSIFIAGCAPVNVPVYQKESDTEVNLYLKDSSDVIYLENFHHIGDTPWIMGEYYKQAGIFDSADTKLDTIVFRESDALGMTEDAPNEIGLYIASGVVLLFVLQYSIK